MSRDSDDDALLEALGRAIKVERVRAGMTQEGLALESRLHRSHVSKIETAQLNPSYVSLRRIAAALGVPLSTIVAAAE